MAEDTRVKNASLVTAEVFAASLRHAMDKRGFKQADLIRMAADRGSKLGKSQVSQYVSGKTLPRRAVVHAHVKCMRTARTSRATRGTV